MAKMTAKQIEALKPQAKPYKRSVDTGLMIRVATDGTKSWIIQYCVEKRQHDYPPTRKWGPITDDAHLSPVDARTLASTIRALAREGIDYRKKLEEDRLATEQAALAEAALIEAQRALLKAESLTIKDMFDTWLADGVRRSDGNAEILRAFNADVLPNIGASLVKAVTEHDIRAILRNVVGRGAKRMAVILKDNLTQMFAWAGKRQPWRKLLAEGDPMALIEIDKIVSPEYDLDNVCDRILSITEIRELHDAFERLNTAYANAGKKRRHVQPVEPTTQAAVWIMLSTLCRVGELSMARWEHVDFDAAEWVIPKANVKGKISALTISLSPFALAQFRKLQSITGKGPYCFPSHDGKTHINVKSITKQIGDRQCMFKVTASKAPRRLLKNRHQSDALVLADGENGPWTPHDLRRTGATLMQSLKIDKVVINSCQNHVIAGGKVERHYLHHKFEEEMREAWLKLGAHLELLLRPKANVIPGEFSNAA